MNDNNHRILMAILKTCVIMGIAGVVLVVLGVYGARVDRPVQG